MTQMDAGLAAHAAEHWDEGGILIQTAGSERGMKPCRSWPGLHPRGEDLVEGLKL
jgi:hypothetical protein